MAISACTFWARSPARHFSDSSRTRTVAIFAFCSARAAPERAARLDWLDRLDLLVLLFWLVPLDSLELCDTWLAESHWSMDSCRLCTSGFPASLSGEFYWDKLGLAIVTMCLNVELCYWMACTARDTNNIEFLVYLYCRST